MSEVIEEQWQQVVTYITEHFNKEPDIKSALFLIGIRELGMGKRNYTKEQKEDLMNLAVCRILSLEGYFEYKGDDKDGWPEWEQKKAFPRLELDEQEAFLKKHIIKYFEQENLIEPHH